MTTELEQIIRQGAKIQQMLFRGIAIFVWMGAVVVGILAVVAPSDPGEEQAKLFVMGFGVVFALTGFYCWYLAKALPEKVINLITKTPQDIIKASHIQIRKNGIVAHAVHFKTKHGKIVGVNVTGPKMAERTLHLVKQELPYVEVEK